MANIVAITPSGLENIKTVEQKVALEDSGNILSMQTHLTTHSHNGVVSTSLYDTSDRTITNTSPEGRVFLKGIDEQGRIVEKVIDGVDPIEYQYNSEGKLINVEHGSRSTAYTYNAIGLVDSIIKPGASPILFEYDLAGRVLKKTLQDGTFTMYSYDANGNISSIIPYFRPEHSFSYNAINSLLDYYQPDLGGGVKSVSREYNLDNQLDFITKSDGTVIDYVYSGDNEVDPNTGVLNRITSPTGDIIFNYNESSGALTAIDNQNISLDYQYDGPLLTTITVGGAVNSEIEMEYNNDFRLIAQSLNQSSIPFDYDLDGLLTQAGNETLSYHSGNGFLIGTSLGTILDSFTYSNYGELSLYSAKHEATDLYSASLERDLLGLITEKNETTLGVTSIYTYEYNSAGGLTKVFKDSVQISEYKYGVNGSRVELLKEGSSEISTYDDQDRLLTSGDQSFTYNANGETTAITRSGVNTGLFKYDSFGNLIQATINGSSVVNYIIDGKNRRVGKKIDGTLIQSFIYMDQLNPIAELDGAGNIVSRFIYGAKATVPDYIIKSGIEYKIISDYLGSPRLVVRVDNGEVKQAMDYDEFGNVTSDSNPGFQPFGYAGGIYDRDTELVRFGARDYNPSTGRWMSKDPIGFGGGDTNLYRYVKNDPVNYVDPTGLIVYDNTGGSMPAEFRYSSQYATLNNDPILITLFQENTQIGYAGLARDLGNQQAVTVNPNNQSSYSDYVDTYFHEANHADMNTIFGGRTSEFFDTSVMLPRIDQNVNICK